MKLRHGNNLSIRIGCSQNAEVEPRQFPSTFFADDYRTRAYISVQHFRVIVKEGQGFTQLKQVSGVSRLSKLYLTELETCRV